MKPPEPFSLPVIVCPACGHGIDPHGTDPGDRCGVGTWNDELGINMSCTCMWSPNDIAATLIANERGRIAAALEAQHQKAGGFCCFSDQIHARLILDARIAREGGQS